MDSAKSSSRLDEEWKKESIEKVVLRLKKSDPIPYRVFKEGMTFWLQSRRTIYSGIAELPAVKALIPTGSADAVEWVKGQFLRGRDQFRIGMEAEIATWLTDPDQNQIEAEFRELGLSQWFLNSPEE